MSLTIEDYYDGLAGLTISGVTRKFTERPTSVETADLPASYVEMPDAEHAPDTAWGSSNEATGKTRTAVLVVAIEPAGQETATANQRATLRMMDAIEAALDGWTLVDTTYRSLSSKQGQPIDIADRSYWGVKVVVTGRGY